MIDLDALKKSLLCLALPLILSFDIKMLTN